MKKVVAAYPGQKVHVVLDDASVHLSKETEEWHSKQRGRVVFHFMPNRRVVDEPEAPRCIKWVWSGVAG